VRNILVGLAKTLWGRIPSGSFKKFCFERFAYVVRNRAVIATVEGMRFELDLGEMIDLGVYLQAYERDVASAIDRFCKSGSTVLDIGANVGAHSLRMAKQIGEKGRVFAFEPTSYAYKKLLRNISLNACTHVYPVQIALSDTNMRRQLINFRSSWRINNTQVAQEPSMVDFARLEDWWRANAEGRFEIVKLDVDGNEFPILKGGLRLIEEFSPLILMEVGAWHFESHETNPVTFLQRLGYRFWDTRSLKEYKEPESLRRVLPLEDKEMTYSLNLIASRSGLAD
jgi:FkbM family methyltransferase